MTDGPDQYQLQLAAFNTLKHSERVLVEDHWSCVS